MMMLLILAIVLLYFLFFGYISNATGKNVGMQLIFLYQVLFNPTTFLSFIILFAIVFIMASREKFFEYAIRNSIWLIPIIMIESWFWYFFIFYDLRTDIWIQFGYLFAAIGQFFINIEGYITIISLLATNLFAAILASIAKEKYNLRIKKGIKIEI